MSADAIEEDASGLTAHSEGLEPAITKFKDGAFGRGFFLFRGQFIGAVGSVFARHSAAKFRPANWRAAATLATVP